MSQQQIKTVYVQKQKRVLNIKNTQYQIIKETCEKYFNFKISNSNSIQHDIIWTDSQLSIEQYQRLKSYQSINFFPGIEQLTKKDLMIYNLKHMQIKYPNLYQFMPSSWQLPMELNSFKIYIQQNQEKTFIVKPQSGCQGKGIYLIQTLDQLDLNQNQIIIQEYIQNPILIDSLKWDLRLYVLIAGTRPLRIYLYKEGMARFATISYQKPNLQNQGNKYQHLTNYAINKTNPQFIFNSSEDKDNIGHKRSFTSVLETLKQRGCNTEKIMEDIQKLIFRSILSVQNNLDNLQQKIFPNNIKNDICFQILGFDILIDKDLKPWLLEVNQSPSFSTETPFDYKLKQNLIKDTFKILNLNSYDKKEQFTQDQFYSNKQLKKKEKNQMHLECIQIQYKSSLDNRDILNMGNYKDIIDCEDQMLIEEINSQNQQQKLQKIQKKNTNEKNINYIFMNKFQTRKQQKKKQELACLGYDFYKQLRSSQNLEQFSQEKLKLYIKPDSIQNKSLAAADIRQFQFDNQQDLYNKTQTSVLRQKNLSGQYKQFRFFIRILIQQYLKAQYIISNFIKEQNQKNQKRLNGNCTQFNSKKYQINIQQKQLLKLESYLSAQKTPQVAQFNQYRNKLSYFYSSVRQLQNKKEQE